MQTENFFPKNKKNILQDTSSKQPINLKKKRIFFCINKNS